MHLDGHVHHFARPRRVGTAGDLPVALLIDEPVTDLKRSRGAYRTSAVAVRARHAARGTARHRLWQRLLAEGVILSERCVQRPPRGLLHGLPRSRPPTEDLANPRLHEMAPVKESRPPAARVAGEGQVVAVPPHPRSEQAQAT